MDQKTKEIILLIYSIITHVVLIVFFFDYKNINENINIQKISYFIGHIILIVLFIIKIETTYKKLIIYETKN